MPEADYFPLIEGLVLEYETTSADGRATLKFEVLSVDVFGAVTTAQCRRTVVRDGKTKTSEAAVIANADGVFSGTYKEFPLPLAVGAGWDDEPRRYKIASLAQEVKVPAGTFQNCLAVSYLIAEGDGGSGERYYAPGVGFISESCNDEAEPFEKRLTRFSIPK